MNEHDTPVVETEPTVKMQGPEGSTAVTHNGVAYTVDQDGYIEVPASYAKALESHGYSVIAPEDAADESVARFNKKKGK